MGNPDDTVRDLIEKEMANPRMPKSAKAATLNAATPKPSGDSTVTLPGTVDEIISPHHGEPEKAQISIQGQQSRGLRIENELNDEHGGGKVGLKKGAHVDVTVTSNKPRK